VKNEAGKLIAKGMATYAIIGTPKAEGDGEKTRH
jgi:hypothetical protein